MPTQNWPQLPITEHLKAIADGVASNSLSIIQAPPGSGKTTVLPLYLAQHEQFHDKRILILQPRRLAAKSVAQRMSYLAKQPLGSLVGYHIRLERKVSADTQIEVMTEGLLTRRIVSDGELAGVGLIIFDEFHERGIHADVGLALAREVASVLRPDLKVVVMSATLDALEGIEILRDAWRYRFESKPHPVEIRYSPPEPRKPIWQSTARLISESLSRYPGDLLAFLPGAGDIERCRQSLSEARVQANIYPLYGELSYEEQQQAITPCPSGARRVVLATNIAETSLTIEGVRIVVDSGLHKVARSTDTGVVTLCTERISKDAADQRTGRAARTAPGTSIRMWSEQEQATLRQAREPEVLRSDITQTVLELAAWGVRDISAFNWVTQPSRSALKLAIDKLKTLGAISGNGSITPLGEQLARFGAHPRIGALCIAALNHNLERYAAAIIPLLEERLPSNTATDLTHIAQTLAGRDRLSGSGSRLKTLYEMWEKRIAKLKVDPVAQRDRVTEEDACGFLLATAFPERIARQREENGERYLMASGRGCALSSRDPLTRYQYLVVAEIHERSDDGLISRAAPLNPRLFETHLKQLVTRELLSEFDTAKGRQTANRITRIGAIELKREQTNDLSPQEAQQALINFLRSEEGMSRLPLLDSHRELQARAAWARDIAPERDIADISASKLRETEPFWLLPFIPKDARLSGITSQDITNALEARLTWVGKRELDSVAPDTFQLPSGKSRAINYSRFGEPVLEVVIQEIFGLSETPLIGTRKKPLTLHLLSPARRPMQVTKDLANFWRAIYPEVRKELRGRYPKHKWPEDPRQ